MISITCTKCQSLLTMDEAFAGGVCRCQYCGTIQTVPAHLKHAGSGTGQGPAGGGSKQLYQSRGNTAGGGAADPGVAPSGLDELADVVASSGLGSRRLTRSEPTGRTPPPGGQRSGGQRAARAGTAAGAGGAASGAAGAAAAHPDYGDDEHRQKKSPTVLYMVAGVVILALLGGVLFLALRNSGDQTAKGKGKDGDPKTTIGADGTAPGLDEEFGPRPGPCFAELALEGVPSISYVIDRGSASEDVFDTMRYEVWESIKSLDPGQRFQIVFWPNTADEGQPAQVTTYPPSGLAPATPDEIQRCEAATEGVVAFGSTELRPALEAAVAAKPAVIILATAKSAEQMETAVADAQAALAGATVVVHTFALDGEANEVLAQIAAGNGGRSAFMDKKKLTALTRRLQPQQ